jgi:hypothetical protein
VVDVTKYVALPIRAEKYRREVTWDGCKMKQQPCINVDMKYMWLYVVHCSLSNQHWNKGSTDQEIATSISMTCLNQTGIQLLCHEVLQQCLHDVY